MLRYTGADSWPGSIIMGFPLARRVGRMGRRSGRHAQALAHSARRRRLADVIAAEPNAGLLPTAANLPETQVRTRLVCIQPGVGAAIRQWPPDHFVELIDLLIANHDVEIVLIGGPDDTERPRR